MQKIESLNMLGAGIYNVCPIFLHLHRFIGSSAVNILSSFLNRPLSIMPLVMVKFDYLSDVL